MLLSIIIIVNRILYYDVLFGDGINCIHTNNHMIISNTTVNDHIL